jgi:hypothetical protein
MLLMGKRKGGERFEPAGVGAPLHHRQTGKKA